MRFLTFIRHSESYRQQEIPHALLEAMGAFIERSKGDGSLVDTGGLRPSGESARVRLAGGRITVSDGPFAESKEVIGGWAILEAPTTAEAVRIATEFLDLHREHWPGFDAECEVRPMEPSP
jgi:hypothetical protein